MISLQLSVPIVTRDISAAIRLAADIVDRPRNEMTCDDLVKCAVKIGQDLGVDVTVISGEQLKEQGFGGKLLAFVKKITLFGLVTCRYLGFVLYVN